MDWLIVCCWIKIKIQNFTYRTSGRCAAFLEEQFPLASRFLLVVVASRFIIGLNVSKWTNHVTLLRRKWSGREYLITLVVCMLAAFLCGLGVTAMIPLKQAKRNGPPWAPFTYVTNCRTSQYKAIFSWLFNSLNDSTNRLISVLNTAEMTWLSAPLLTPIPKFVA